MVSLSNHVQQPFDKHRANGLCSCNSFKSPNRLPLSCPFIDEVKTSVASFKRLAKEVAIPVKVINPIADCINTMLMV